jgi:hypothetical protein
MNEIVKYVTNDLQAIEVLVDEDTVWLTQAQMVELFASSKANISTHVKNILQSDELEADATVRNFRTVRIEGKRAVNREVKHYNLDMIISLGYRINSKVATQFRIWATNNLHEFIQKGFVVDSKRLKNPDVPFDYFEELEAIIQDIRTSERRFYLKITDIYATSIDYDKDSSITRDFFATVQNKMHWAVSDETAAEIVYHRADASKKNMGLTSWRGVRIRKPDVIIAKNYLNKDEIQALNDLTEQYLLFAQTQARAHRPMTMQDWIDKLHGFLTLNGRDILQNAGKISHELAVEHAESEYDIFRVKQAQIPYNRDFEDFLIGGLNNIGEEQNKLGDSEK